MIKKSLYLDYAATTPVDPHVADVMHACLTSDGNYGNPASRAHGYGWQAEEAVEVARRQVADLIGADPREIVWTSGATESDNLAIKGVVQALGGKDQHIVTTQIEHKAVLDTCAYLQTQGVDVTYVAPDKNGYISADNILRAVRDDTVLVSVMQVNNETGVVNDIVGIGQACRERGILFHCDAAQSVGKLDVNVKQLHVDLLSISAHKMYGPKGVGALYVRRHPDVKIMAQIHGGGHERGMRSGSLPTHQIAGFGAAAEIAKAQLSEGLAHLSTLRTHFLKGLNEIDGIRIHEDEAHQFPGIINVEFVDIDGETMLLSLRELAISSGSACTSASVDPSYVLTAMGLSNISAHNSLRFSFGRTTHINDVTFAVKTIQAACTALV